MNEAMSRHWNEVRRHEAARDLHAAKAAYEALLALDPMQIVPRLRLSRFAQQADSYVESRAHALEAARIAIETHAIKDVGFVSLRLLAFAEDGEILRLIQALDWSDPGILSQAAVLAQHLWLIGEHEKTLEFLAHAATRVRPNHLLSYTRANVLRSLGRLEEASEHYEYALQLSPHDAYVHRSLAYHQRARPAGARVPRIRAARQHHPGDSWEQAQLCYALFNELDGMDDSEAAWDALQEGARLMRGKLRHDREAEARALQRLQRSEMPVRAPSVSNDAAPTPIFIVGMPRTGTTLLDRVMGNHPGIVSVGERNDFDAAVSQVSDHFYQGGLKETDWRKLEGIDFSKVGEIYLGRLARLAGGSRYFIDKNPHNFFNTGLILRALPQARIVCLRRDPMDACFSNLKELFEGGAFPYSYAFADLAAHQRGFTALLHHWLALAPDSVHVVDYEALVRQGDDTLREVMDFCRLEVAPGMLDITANATPVSTASSSQVRQPINDRSIGAWKRYAPQLEPLRAMLEGQA